MENVSEKSEVISRNFIEQIIDKDLEEGIYDKLLNSHDSRWSHNGRNVFPEDEESKDWNYWEDFLKEAYLIAPVNDIKNSPHGRTPFSKSGCKYPHHEIRNGELVLSVPVV